MSTDDAKPDWTDAIIALPMIVVAVVGGLSLYNYLANSGTKAPVAVATSCRGFEVDAQKLLDPAGTAALSGTFAPGDHVHLAIDLNGADYAWKLTGVLGNKPDAHGSGTFQSVKHRTISTTTITYGFFTKTTKSHGDIHGFATLEMDIDVTTAGHGVITLSRTGGEPSSTPAKLASASCTASGKKSLPPMV